MPRNLLLFLLLCCAHAAHAAQDLQFWHSSTGSAAAALEELVARFNASQSRYQVIAQYRQADALQEFSEARTQARRAKQGLKEGSPGWLRAEDILTATDKPDERDRSREHERERDRDRERDRRR